MGYFNNASLTPDTRPFSDEGWSIDDRRAAPLPDGLRIARYDEPGWVYKTPTNTLWVTDAPAAPSSTPQLCTCPRCGHPAQHEETPHGEGYTTCGHCAGIAFDATGEEDEPASEFYAQARVPTALINWSYLGAFTGSLEKIEPACPSCGDHSDGLCAACKEAGETAAPLSPIEALRKIAGMEIQHATCLDNQMRDIARAALEAADEEALARAEQLACARQHVNETFQRWQFEAQTTDIPF